MDKSAEALAQMPADRWIEVSYEEFVHAPQEGLQRILVFLGMEAPENAKKTAVSAVSPHSIGKGRQALGPEGEERLFPIIQDTLHTSSQTQNV